MDGKQGRSGRAGKQGRSEWARGDQGPLLEEEGPLLDEGSPSLDEESRSPDKELEDRHWMRKVRSTQWTRKSVSGRPDEKGRCFERAEIRYEEERLLGPREG